MNRINLIAVGDIAFGQGMASIFLRRGADVFSKVEEITKSTDLAIGNLECTLSDRGEPIPTSRKVMLNGRITRIVHMRGDPAAAQVLGRRRVSALDNNSWSLLRFRA